jgi:acyl carrier protein
MTQQTIDRDTLRALVADVLDVDPSVVTDDAHFVNDLDVDSLLALELAVTLERDFGIKIESEEVAEVQRLRDVETLLDRKRAALTA